MFPCITAIAEIKEKTMAQTENKNYELSDFVIHEENADSGLNYQIWKKKVYNQIAHSNLPKMIAKIKIPRLCFEKKMRFAEFIPQFDKILCELLVICNKDTVAKFYSAAKNALFPEEEKNFEIEFYDFHGGIYSCIDYTPEYYKQLTGKEKEKSWAEKINDNIPKRTLFQTRDEIWEKYSAEAIAKEKAKELRKRHPRRKQSLREFFESQE